MRKIIGLGIFSLCAVAFLASAAGAYTINLFYDIDANYAKAFVNNDVIAPGQSLEEFQQGTASKEKTYTGPDSRGKAVTQQTALPYSAWNNIISTEASAGPISSPHYTSQGLGYGDTYFAIKITKDSGDTANQVFVTLGYKIDGTYNLSNAGDNPNSYLLAQVRYFAELRSPTQEILGTASSPKVEQWKGSNLSGSFNDQGVLTAVLNVNTDYYFYGGLESQVLAYAYDYNPPGTGTANFKAYLSIGAPSAVPLPGALMLMGGGLLRLLAYYRRQN